MKKIQSIFAAALLVTVFALGTSMANAGIIINSLGDDTCPTESSVAKDGIIINSLTKDGIIINSLTGIIINSLTGIIINSFGDDDTKECGIIINS